MLSDKQPQERKKMPWQMEQRARAAVVIKEYKAERLRQAEDQREKLMNRLKLIWVVLESGVPDLTTD